MKEAIAALESIPTDAVVTAMTVGGVGCLVAVVGVGVVLASRPSPNRRQSDTVSDGFEESLLDEQSAKSKRFLGFGLVVFGVLTTLFAVFSYTSPEARVARLAGQASSALEEGDLSKALEDVRSACAEVECHDPDSNLIVAPELPESIGRADVLVTRERATALLEAGELDAAYLVVDELYARNSSKEVVDTFNLIHRARAVKLEEEGAWKEAATAFEEGEDFEAAARLYTERDAHDELCRILPNIQQNRQAAAACEKAGKTGRAGYYYVLAGEPAKAADAYIRGGWDKQGIDILLEAKMNLEAATAYTEWARKSDEKAADHFLAAAGLYEELGDTETSVARKKEAADAYAALAETTENSTQRVAAWQLYNDLGETEAAAEQLEAAIRKTAEFRSVGALMELVRLDGSLGRGVEIVRGWAEDALARDEPHEAAQYLTLLLANIMGPAGNLELPEDELAQIEPVLPGLLATNAKVASQVARYPTTDLKAFAMSMTFPDSGLEIHQHTRLTGTITNPHDYAIESIDLRVVLFEPRIDTDEINREGWRRIMSEKGVSEEEARSLWKEQTSKAEEELYSAPVGFKTDISLGRLEPGETITVERELDSDVSYQFIDHYFVKMKMSAE